MSYEIPVIKNNIWMKQTKVNCDRSLCDRNNRCICDIKECICCGKR
jgi:hypothetical protein